MLNHNKTDSMIEGTVCPISFVKDVLVCVGFFIVSTLCIEAEDECGI